MVFNTRTCLVQKTRGVCHIEKILLTDETTNNKTGNKVSRHHQMITMPEILVETAYETGH